MLKYKLTLLLLAGLIGLSFSQAHLQPYFSKNLKFSNPLGIVKAPEMSDYLFVLEQRGMIYKVADANGASVKLPFLDFRKFVSQEGSETGLLGMAFHPQYPKNNRVFLSYTSGTGKNLISNIAEIVISENGLSKKNTITPKILMTVKQPYTNHNGGAIAFGPDGYLYFSWGDGGAGGDPENHAQDLNSYYGKIFRIDVNQKSGNHNYSVPPSNPFVGKPGVRPEIYAYGLRNVWQMHFEKPTGQLWAGDVGQNAVEEIDRIELGKNYGWRIREGNSGFKPEEKKDGQILEEPVYSYSQKDGDQSVTGGLVYHGAFKAWQGRYIFGDFMSGRIWILHKEEKSASLLVDRKIQRHGISCFGENRAKEVLVCDYNDGRIYLLRP